MLDIGKDDDVTAIMIGVICPICKSPIYLELPELALAINGEEKLRCDDCKGSFDVKFELLDPRSPTLREPEPAFAGAVEYCQHISEKIDGTCPYCDLPKPPRS